MDPVPAVGPMAARCVGWHSSALCVMPAPRLASSVVVLVWMARFRHNGCGVAHRICTPYAVTHRAWRVVCGAWSVRSRCADWRRLLLTQSVVLADFLNNLYCNQYFYVDARLELRILALAMLSSGTVTNRVRYLLVAGAVWHYGVDCRASDRTLHAPHTTCPNLLNNTDFIGDNKYEQSTATASDCCALCSSVGPCHYWTFEGTAHSAGACFLKASSSTPSGHVVQGRVSGHFGAHSGRSSWPKPPPPPPSPPPAPFACRTARDCSLNGVCKGVAQCTCDAGWAGQRCDELDVLPAQRVGGYHYNINGGNISSWGGPIVRGPDGTHHMWAAEMTHHCGINSWERNSQIVHATTTDAAGASYSTNYSKTLFNKLFNKLTWIMPPYVFVWC